MSDGGWRGTCRASWGWAGLVLVVVGLAAAVEARDAAWAFVGCIPLGLCVFAFHRIDVTIDDRAITIRYGLGGWPVQRIGLDRIRRVEAIELDPLKWGGWGYRGSLRLGTRRRTPSSPSGIQAAVVLRKGPAFRLDLDEDFKEFAVTVDDPAGAVDAIRSRLA